MILSIFSISKLVLKVLEAKSVHCIIIRFMQVSVSKNKISDLTSYVEDTDSITTGFCRLTEQKLLATEIERSSKVRIGVLNRQRRIQSMDTKMLYQ